MRVWVRLGFIAIVALTIAGGAGAEDTKLRGIVGPGFTISLVDAQGNQISRVPAGPAEIEVEDRSGEHNFHLTEPGVDRATSVEGSGSTTFRVTLENGTYTFFCDPHSYTLSGSFVAGAGAPSPTPPPPSPPPPTTKPSAPVGAQLVLTSGPGFRITLKTTAGRAVTMLRPGAYAVVARDRSTIHNARVRGAGASRATTVGGVATQTGKSPCARASSSFSATSTPARCAAASKSPR